MSQNKAHTLGELRASGYQSRSVKEEMRQNLINKLRKGEDIFPGIVGYEETVIPQIENAILSGQDIVFLGERGQAKTRIARSLINLLDEEMPAIKGADLNDDPLNPISAVGKSLVAELGDSTPIEWIPRNRRYGEKLATPDITISDLIGEVDPIKVAEGRYLSDEMTIHYGLIPRTNRGIFAINELPDLAERIQVGLLNIMEERDVQIRGYKIRLDLDLFVVASANPEDYTNRGRIVTPLKDRFGSEIRTHYPRTIEHEINIIEQEATKFKTENVELIVPRFMKEIVAEVTHLARRSPDISQRSGVSVRVSVSNYENLVSNALRRAIVLGEKAASPRISDLHALISSTAGKVELETMGDNKEERVIEKLVQGAVLNTFNRNFGVTDFEQIIRGFDSGLNMEISEFMPSMEYVHQAAESPELKRAVAKLQAQGSPVTVATAVEFVLEGLHLNRRLNKDRNEGKLRYRR
ncbi:MAG: AAA family ATPase [Chloroflexi bacterium]|uniref:AAA family ATPase n=1 Tax=Candidatus Chlorohelix allophototropha TaxID=3003348 RepID=A0A8T7M2F1_9CHLR|nr:AAA family ATPase [Chloroflexota bacterium]WJW67113.1 AAA family ATPase [Chloroflexota bacterium L227-S17]